VIDGDVTMPRLGSQCALRHGDREDVDAQALQLSTFKAQQRLGKHFRELICWVLSCGKLGIAVYCACTSL
jgi:hypothetical protein